MAETIITAEKLFRHYDVCGVVPQDGPDSPNLCNFLLVYDVMCNGSIAI